MVVEHIVPLAAGGTSTLDNLCLSCYRCNEFKGHASSRQTRRIADLFRYSTRVCSAGMITLPGVMMV